MLTLFEIVVSQEENQEIAGGHDELGRNDRMADRAEGINRKMISVFQGV